MNKGTGFTAAERKEFKLHGLLPSNVQTLEEQVQRAYEQYSSRSSDILKNSFMTSLKEQNEVLYYRLIMDHLKEMFPIIYTPTEGEAIAAYSKLFRRSEGCFLNIDDRDQVEDNMAIWGKPDDIDVIVVSDGEQVNGFDSESYLESRAHGGTRFWELVIKVLVLSSSPSLNSSSTPFVLVSTLPEHCQLF